MPIPSDAERELERERDPGPTTRPDLAGSDDAAEKRRQHERERMFEFFRLNLEPSDVDYHWQRLLIHQSQFPSRPDGSRVDFRTAAFDYFLNETDLLDEPLVMERESLRQTELMAYLDHLTGLRNYAYFENEIKTEVAKARRYDMSLCLLLVDLDGFKEVNDTLGHRVGNDVLREVGRTLRNRLRSTDLIARFGGDEFAAVLHRTHPEDGCRVAKNLCGSIHRRFGCDRYRALGRRLTASVGLSTLPNQAEDETELFELADRALYEAKRAGGNQVVLAH